MDPLERELTSMLAEVSKQADPAAERLRNPAEHRSRRSSRFQIGRLHTGWAVAASSLAVAAVVVGIGAGITAGTSQKSPGQTVASPGIGAADGTHPLWKLTLAEGKQTPVEQLPTAAAVAIPKPYTVDPQLVPDLVSEPELVTATGTIRFGARTRAVHLLAQRSQGTFVYTTGLGHDGKDGLYDVRVLLVAPDNTKREFYRAAKVGSLDVSPDGATLAVKTWPAGTGEDSESVVELVDVSTGKVAHRLPGGFTKIGWASDRAVVLGAAGQATSLVWKAPWTAAPEPTDASIRTATPAGGGLVAIDARGCLQRIDADAMVVAANCNGWRFADDADSPDGRYLPLEWGSKEHPERGVLDVAQNQIRSWPIDGGSASWLSSTTVLLDDPADDSAWTALCDMTTNTCEEVPEDTTNAGIWRGASWLGQ